MGVLDHAVHLIGDASSFFGLLTVYAEFHARKPNFQSESFWKICPALTDAVKETLGDSYTQNMANIYEVFFDLVIGTMVASSQAAMRDNAAETK
uniref:Globin family profile domain-containing protein n=1 Tax=Trichuris muris TaxID=70415 RepID=A0A5S6R669_TRIMR